MGKYADSANSKNRNLSASQIRANKCARSKQRNETRREERRKEAEERNKSWTKLSTKEKLASLDSRRGKSVKQRKRILEAV